MKKKGAHSRGARCGDRLFCELIATAQKHFNPFEWGRSAEWFIRSIPSSFAGFEALHGQGSSPLMSAKIEL